MFFLPLSLSHICLVILSMAVNSHKYKKGYKYFVCSFEVVMRNKPFNTEVLDSQQDITLFK